MHDDNCYWKYYEVVYILFHTGLRISELCGLTLQNIDLKNKTINVNHQLQRTNNMKYVIERTKTNVGTRVLPMNDDVAKCSQTIIEEREVPKVETMVDRYSGFLFMEDDGMPLVATAVCRRELVCAQRRCST